MNAFIRSLPLALALSLVGTLGCQTYDFEPVEPVAFSQKTQAREVISRNFKPNLMLVIDKSGSMDQPVNPLDPNCPANCGASKANLCPAGCATRWTELQNAMDDFLTQNPPVARLGMMTYPIDPTCGAPSAVRIELTQLSDDDEQGLLSHAAAINAEIKNITSAGPIGTPNATGGGTPTAATLSTLIDYAPLNDGAREDLVLLLTDGLPNCDETNPNNACDIQNPNPECRCTLAGDCIAEFCSLGCLDVNGAEKAIKDLLARNIRTIVVGFGAETATGDGPMALNRMAAAGGFARACPSGNDAECGAGDVCETSTTPYFCRTKFYPAQNGAELIAALERISNLIGNEDPCLFKLEASPSDPRFLSVLIDGVAITSSPDTWTFTLGTSSSEPSTVRFHGQICQRLQDATPSSRVNVEFRIVETL